jgi:hypothetical protein
MLDILATSRVMGFTAAADTAWEVPEPETSTDPLPTQTTAREVSEAEATMVASSNSVVAGAATTIKRKGDHDGQRGRLNHESRC